jgi:hypothetical protein
MRWARAHGGRDGFTLVEVLAAFAIMTAIIIGSAGLVHHVALHFDRGTRGVGEADRLALAVERLSAEFASARFVPRSSEAGTVVAFAGEQASGGKPAKIVFVGAAGIGGPPREEVVDLTVEEGGNLMRLVRRRAAWLGPRARFEDVAPQDPVVLIEGKFDISFLFGRVTPSLTWYSSWIAEAVLPRFVRLILRDRATGGDLLGEADFVIRADAPEACARPDAAVGCLFALPMQTDTSPFGRAVQ